MPYRYEEEIKNIDFSDPRVLRLFTEIKERMDSFIGYSGSVTVDKILDSVDFLKAGVCVNWEQLAVIDHVAQVFNFREITKGFDVPGQYRTFTRR